MRLIDADELIKCIPSEEYNSRFAVMNAPTVEPSKWIPVSERLPEYRQTVLISSFFGVKVAIRDAVEEDGTDDYWYLFLDDATTNTRYVYAWMPLPEPWKEGNNEVE